MTNETGSAERALAARRGLGVAAVARGLIRLTGSDRVRFLQGLVTNDVAALGEGSGMRAVILSVKGRVVADVHVVAEADALLVATPPELAKKVRDLLARYAIADDVDIADVSGDWEAIGVVGPGAAAVTAEDARALAMPEHGPGGRELWLPRGRRESVLATLVGAGAVALDAAALEVLRIEQGEPRYGVDVSEDDLPIEARLDGAISVTKGCYMGQEVIARTTARGHINRRLSGLVADALPAVGAKLAAPERPDAGQVTSACYSVWVGRFIALGYVHRSVWDPGTQLTADGVAVTVVALPFSVTPSPGP